MSFNDSKLNSLAISVKDTGIGIAKENHKSIFEPFVQVEGEYAGKNEGTGLGLAICKRLIKLMKGKISLESERGKGSTFLISFYDVSIARDSGEKTTEIETETINFKGKTILIADDTPSSRLILKGYLENTSATILEAANGEEALEILKKQQVDLLLLDMMMPKKDGYETSKEIRQINHLKNLLIIANSAISFNEESENLFVYCDERISKPINRSELNALISKLLVTSKSTNGSGLINKSEINNEHELVRNFKNRYSEVAELMSNDDVALLADELLKYAEKMNEAALTNYARRLKESAINFDLSEMETIFNQLKPILQIA